MTWKFFLWLESPAARGTFLASSHLQSKSQYLREFHLREPSPNKTKRKNSFGKHSFSAFRYPSPLNNVLELPWIFFLSYSTGRNHPKGALKFHFFITSFYNYVLWFRHERLTSWGFFQPCKSRVALVNTT